MKRKPYTVQEKAELLKSDAIEKIANSSVTLYFFVRFGDK